MNGQFEVGELHPYACLSGWWFGLDSNPQIPEEVFIGEKILQQPISRPIIYICKDQRVVFVAETQKLSFHADFMGFAKALAAINQTWP